MYLGRGSVQWECYYRDGVMRREDGPAFLQYEEKGGGVMWGSYYLGGVKQPGGLVRGQNHGRIRFWFSLLFAFLSRVEAHWGLWGDHASCS